MSCKLKELLDEKGYIRGPFGSALRRNEMLDEGIPVYEQQNAIYNHRNFRYYINNEKHEKMKRFTVRENDLIISCSGTVGRISIIKKDDPIGIISQALLILRPNNEKVLTKFLFYFFTSKTGYNSIISRSGGSVQANISKRAVIENIDIDIPSLEEQKSIVNILSSLDDKIETNNKINKTLEEMAQAIFKHWFVDFEFPDENGKPYKSGGDQMVESELGMIPKGWEVKRITEIIDVLSGGTPKTSNNEYWDDGEYPFYTPKDSAFSNYVLETERYLSKSGLIMARSGLLTTDTIVITARGTVGKINLLGKPMTINQSCYAVVGKIGYSQYFIFELLKNNIEYLKMNTHGSVFNTITKSTFESIKVIVPKTDIIKAFTDLVDSMYVMMKECSNESIVLSDIRDTLLPKLMSGEIRVDA